MRVTLGIGGALRYCYAHHVDVAAENGATWRRYARDMMLRFLAGGVVRPTTFSAEWIDADENAERFPAWECRSCGETVRESAWHVEFETAVPIDRVLAEIAKLAEVLHQDAIWATIDSEHATVFDGQVTRALAPILA